MLVDGGKKESTLDVYSTFERMEVSRDKVGSLNFFLNFQKNTLSGLVTPFVTGLNAKPKFW